MYRRFVNLRVHNERTELYSLRRLGIIPHLFDEPPAADAQVATASKKGYASSSTISSWNCLPRTDINFALPPKIADTTPMHFFSLLRGQGEGCVMFIPPFGQTTVYDVDMQAVISMPQPSFSMPSDSISLSMIRRADSHGVCYHDHDQLYVMGRAEGNGTFEVFNYCRTGAPTVGAIRCWSWDPLPPAPQAEPYQLGGKRCRPSAAAVVDETTICASSIDGGAYTFDTVECEWRQAGSWVLPFNGAAEYVPELGLWFGLQATAGNPHHRLCAFDLSSSSWPPVVQHAWDYLDDGLALPGDWRPWKRHLVNLGSGRFCIATSFRKAIKHTTSDEEHVETEYGEVTLLTGVDVVRGGSSVLEMIKHKSRLYDIEGMRIHCVL
ncbi:unnamed protein product [Alopecurus aequalis]